MSNAYDDDRSDESEVDAQAAAAELPFGERPTGLMIFIALFGVLLPLVALAFELKTRLSRSVFFDPVPTFFHVALIAATPVASVVLLTALGKKQALGPLRMLLVSFANGIAAFYALLYLPLTPLAPFAMLWYGLGFVILSPLLALVCIVKGRKRLQRLAPWRYFKTGVGLALAALLALNLPSALTSFGMQLTLAKSAEQSLDGVRFLRMFGNHEAMIAMCYPGSSLASDTIGWLHNRRSRVSPQHARTVFYRVTGTPFNDYPAPQRRTLRDWEATFDQDRGGEKVGGRADGVSLASSRMDGSVDANAATAYLEWTMVLHNSALVDQEGRAEIALPPGAVVSRLTLWINGEEREAAFGGRGQVRKAYEAVVRQNRDPVLVTTAGKDRVLVQLFPIPARGGEMKVRIGFTAPMALDTLQSVHLQLPSFSERNFDIAPGLKHALWVESASPLKGGAGMREERLPGGGFAVRGDITETEQGKDTMHGTATVTAVRLPGRTLAWSADPLGGDGQAVVQQLQLQPMTPPSRVVLVIDGSLSMRPLAPELFKVLAIFPSNVELGLVFAGDKAPVVFPHDRSNADATRAWLAGLSFEGGRDNTAALSAAWDWAGQQAGGALVWVHGPQAFELGSLEPLLQRLQRHPGRVRLVDMAAMPGPDLVGRQLDGQVAVTKVARQGALHDDLARLFAQWKPGYSEVVAVRERRATATLAPSERTSSHLTRLWAAGEIARLIDSGKPKDRRDATALAVRYQLVTPVSGAVVLETAAQYKQAGLEPVAAGSVPTIPEPETWLMMIVALCVLAWRYRHRKAEPQPCSGQPA